MSEPQAIFAQQPLVSIVTRTKSRPQYLKRVLDSLTNQTLQRFEWIIVNDGGPVSDFDHFSALLDSVELKVYIEHLESSIGRASAANVGVSRAQGDWVILLDDDDSWHPGFLDECVRWLTMHSEYQAVTTHVNIVEEIERNGSIHTIRNIPAPFNTDAITFANMYAFNRVCTNSLMLERELWLQLGGYDKSLDVLEDYDFVLRCLMETNIGVIHKCLANYHVRKNTNGNAANSDPGEHKRILAEYRNRLVREDLRKGKFGLGSLVMFGEVIEDLYHVKNRWSPFFSKVKSMTRRIWRKSVE